MSLDVPKESSPEDVAKGLEKPARDFLHEVSSVRNTVRAWSPDKRKEFMEHLVKKADEQFDPWGFIIESIGRID